MAGPHAMRAWAARDPCLPARRCHCAIKDNLCTRGIRTPLQPPCFGGTLHPPSESTVTERLWASRRGAVG